MRVDLHRWGARRNRLLATCQAIAPTLIILMTCVSCAKRAAEMQEPSYRIAEPALSLFSRLTDGENQHLPQRRVDEQPLHRAEQHRTSPPPKAAKLQTPETTRALPPRPVSGKTNPPPPLDRGKEQMFQEFLEWRNRKRDMP
jgi:hypothetical protein